MKPKKFKQGFQTKENGLKEQEFVKFLRIYPQITTNQLQSMLLNGRNDVCPDRKHPWLLISDLAFLISNRWLSSEVMQLFISLINGIWKNVNIASLVELRDLRNGGKLEELILGWKKNNLTSVCVIANVGKEKLDETFLASTTRTGNYWACFQIDLTYKTLCTATHWLGMHHGI